MLVVTPSPKRTESLTGYLIRLAEANGYESPGTILCYAGYSSAQSLGTHCDLRLLAGVLNRSAEDLKGISYGDAYGQSSGTVAYHGHDLSTWRIARILSPRVTSICPSCIEEQGNIDAFWDLTLATACPKHGCRSLRVCPACNETLSWLRPGLQECRCGASLSDSKPRKADNREVELLGMLRAKFEHVSLQGCDNSSRFPVANLARMSFEQLASFLFVLGQQLEQLSHRQALARPDEVISSAARALSNWPKGFRRSLRRLDKGGEGSVCQLDRLRDRYGALFRAITQERGFASEAQFLRKEFESFLENEKARVVLSDKRLDSRTNVRLRHSMTMDWICERYDFSRKRVEGWCKANQKDNSTVSPRDLRRFVVEAEIVNRLKIAKTKAITERRAAAMAGVPVSVLKGLREYEYLGLHYTDSSKRGYRASDIEKLTKMLQNVGKRVPHTSIKSKDHVSLARLLETTTLWSRLGKSEFLIDVLEGRVQTYGRTGNSLQQLYLDRAHVNDCVAAKRKAEFAQCMTMTEAGKILGCSWDCIDELLKFGHLETTSGPYYRKVCRASVRRFGELHIALNAVAKQFRSSARAVSRKASEIGLALVMMTSKRGVTTSFVRRSDVDILRNYIEQLRFEAQQRSNMFRTRLSALDKLSQYLNSMLKAGQPLPRSGKKLNLRTLARATGICRNIFYSSQEAREILSAAERKDARMHGIDSRPDLEILESYLEELRSCGRSIPIGNKGEPNKLKIACGAGVDRNVFYHSQQANRLLARFCAQKAPKGTSFEREHSKLTSREARLIGGVRDD